ncbi:SDR family NAD(P)-dependent oxidoreductase [Sphingomonas sp.]|uniref:SDR family NAD(P)-dependent oxidoreductase n=1 Tax=Sphingomonas sp. TaxID=28214 RepID=UPI003D6C84C0
MATDPPAGVAGLKFVITGAAEGMGAATARMAAARGARVCLADINVTKGEALAASIRQAGGEAWFLPCDITDDTQLAELMDGSAARMGGIDILHNNAGVIDSQFGDQAGIGLEQYDRTVWDMVIAVNLTAPMFAAKAALPWLKQSANASIITAASTASFVANPSTLAYGASKGGVAALTKNLAVELAPLGIRANSYCPGVIETGLVGRYLESVPNPDELIRSFVKTQLVPRLGQPEEVAALVCFLAGQESRFVNGVVWLIDGGQLAWRGTVDMIGM